MSVLILLLLVAATYANSLGGAFLLDDEPRIVDNPQIRSLLPFWKLLASSNRPIPQLSVAINYALGGLDTFGYHLFNTLVHAGCALLLFGVIRRGLVGTALRRSADKVAFVASALWAVHPLQTQAVSYIIQRHESLMSLFYLSTLYALARCAYATRPLAWGGLACLACALGMATKEVMVTAPLVALLYDRTFLAGSFGQALRQRLWLYLGLAGCWGVLFLCAGGSLWDPEEAGFVGHRDPLSSLEYFRTQPGVLLHYLGLVFWPRRLVFDYDWPVAEGLGSIALPTLILSFLGLATVWALRYRPAAGFLGASFFLILAPTSSFMPLADLAFEHRMYLPSVAVILFSVLAALRFIEVRSAVPIRLPGLLVIVAIALLGTRTLRRNRDYRTAVTMWETVRRDVPHSTRAYINLGIAYAREKQPDAARAILEQGLALNPGNVRLLVNLAGVEVQQGQPEAAISMLRKVLKVEPENAEVRSNLGIALAATGDLPRALSQLERTVAIDPTYAEGYNNLGVILEKSGRLAEASRAFERALALNRDHAGARANSLRLRRKLERRARRAAESSSSPP